MPKIENLTFQLREKQAKNCRDKFKVTLEENKEFFVEEICSIRLSNDAIGSKTQ